MLNIIVSGAAGRMGRRIIALSKDNKNLKIIGALERRDHKGIGFDGGELIGIGKLGIVLSHDLNEIKEKADVLIEFSNTKTSLEHIKNASDRSISMVIGTTGFSNKETADIKH